MDCVDDTGQRRCDRNVRFAGPRGYHAGDFDITGVGANRDVLRLKSQVRSGLTTQFDGLTSLVSLVVVTGVIIFSVVVVSAGTMVVTRVRIRLVDRRRNRSEPLGKIG